MKHSLPSALLLIVCNAAVSTVVFADVDSGDLDADQENQVIDEIEVIGRKTTRQLEKIVVEARLDFWGLYNSINNVPDYRVNCERIAPIGSNIKRLRCVPRYYSDKMAEVSQQRMRRDVNGNIQLIAQPPDQEAIISATRKKKAEADAYMVELIESNPLLLEKYEALLEANEAYERSQASD
ncbi:MAG: hypothetical protein AAFO81_00705 [Pseudomonadota bacterium]